jgi:hypothetical protein
MKFYATVQNWRVLSQSQKRDRQIQKLWPLKMTLFHFFCLILHDVLIQKLFFSINLKHIIITSSTTRMVK